MAASCQGGAAGKDDRHDTPQVETMPWDEVMSVTDPYGNTIRFTEATGA